MKNWAAIRRKGRRARPAEPSDHRLPAIAMPARTEPDGSPTGYLGDVTIQGWGVGIEVPEGGYTVADKLRTLDCDVGVDNHGRFDGPNTVIE